MEIKKVRLSGRYGESNSEGHPYITLYTDYVVSTGSVRQLFLQAAAASVYSEWRASWMNDWQNSATLIMSRRVKDPSLSLEQMIESGKSFADSVVALIEYAIVPRYNAKAQTAREHGFAINPTYFSVEIGIDGGERKDRLSMSVTDFIKQEINDEEFAEWRSRINATIEANVASAARIIEMNENRARSESSYRARAAKMGAETRRKNKELERLKTEIAAWEESR